MPENFTALLVDDEQPALNLLKTLLNEAKVFSKILTTTKPQTAISICEKEKPNVLFLDVEMPQLDGFELLEKINGYIPEVVFVTAHSHYAIQAIKVSCLHYILKPPDREEIKSIIYRLREKSFVDNKLRKLHYEKISFYKENYQLFNTLTEREKEALQLIVQGLTNKQIGKELNISSLTVKTHRQNIYRKLGASHIQDLVQFVEVF